MVLITHKAALTRPAREHEHVLSAIERHIAERLIRELSSKSDKWSCKQVTTTVDILRYPAELKTKLGVRVEVLFPQGAVAKFDRFALLGDELRQLRTYIDVINVAQEMIRAMQRTTEWEGFVTQCRLVGQTLQDDEPDYQTLRRATLKS